MNTLLTKSLFLALAAAGVLPVLGDPPKDAAAKPAVSRSVFVQPASAREGRDPFFPESVRPYEETQTVTNAPQPAVLTVKGLSVDHGHAMVIINNHTFAVGDEGEVRSGGKRLHLRLVEIRAGTAVIEVNGSRRELRITTQ